MIFYWFLLSLDWALADLVTILRAAGESNRIRILTLCADCDLSAGELTRILGQSQPSISRHLRLLCDAGLLERHQEGSWAFFHLPTSGTVAKIVRFMVEQIEDDNPLVIRDRDRLDAIKRERRARSERYFNQNAARWDQIRTMHVDEKRVEAEIRNMVSTLQVKDLLDIGTGTGRMLQLCADQVQHAIGIDLSHDMLSVARVNLSEPNFNHCIVRHADMYGLPFGSPSFDLAILHMVLHFADQPWDVIGEASRVIRSGGHLLLVDFAPHDVQELREKHEHRRLGFRNKEIASWSKSHLLKISKAQSLPSKNLTVNIWLLCKGHTHAPMHANLPQRSG